MRVVPAVFLLVLFVSCSPITVNIYPPGSAQTPAVPKTNFLIDNEQQWETFVPGWTINGSSLYGTNTQPNIRTEAVYRNGNDWTDYTVTATVTVQSTYEPADAQVIFRYQDPQHYGACRFMQYQGVTFELLQISTPPGEKSVIAKTPFPLEQNKPYTIRATIKGDKATCEVIGHPDATISGTYHLTDNGTVALRNTHIPVSFTDVSVERR